jgi:phosphoribosylformylglycinamidine synthase subunit PurS
VKAVVMVRPKDGILDPQGDAVRTSLRKLGFDVSGTRVGRLIDLELTADGPADAEAQVERMCSELLANPLIESYEIVLEGA